jgi:hypothetical protein
VPPLAALHVAVAFGREGQLPAAAGPPEQVATHVPPLAQMGVLPEQSALVQHAAHASP